MVLLLTIFSENGVIYKRILIKGTKQLRETETKEFSITSLVLYHWAAWLL